MKYRKGCASFSKYVPFLLCMLKKDEYYWMLVTVARNVHFFLPRNPECSEIGSMTLTGCSISPLENLASPSSNWSVKSLHGKADSHCKLDKKGGRFRLFLAILFCWVLVERTAAPQKLEIPPDIALVFILAAKLHRVQTLKNLLSSSFWSVYAHNHIVHTLQKMHENRDCVEKSPFYIGRLRDRRTITSDGGCAQKQQQQSCVVNTTRWRCERQR